LFGVYDNFPDIIHGFAHFECDSSPSELGSAIIRALYRMNRSGRFLSSHRIPTPLGCRVRLEFGVADGTDFNYIDEDVLSLSSDILSRVDLDTLDFLCVVRYYRIEKRMRKPLRFDYYLLRFMLGSGGGEVRVFHERGIRRLPIEDLILILIDSVNRELSRAMGRGRHPHVKLTRLRAL